MLPSGGPPSGLDVDAPSGFAGGGLKPGCGGLKLAGGGLKPEGGGLNFGCAGVDGGTAAVAPAPGIVRTVLHLGQRAERPAVLSGVRIFAWQDGHWNSMGMACHASSLRPPYNKWPASVILLAGPPQPREPKSRPGKNIRLWLPLKVDIGSAALKINPTYLGGLAA
jgi:hypothetical protein